MPCNRVCVVKSGCREHTWQTQRAKKTESLLSFVKEALTSLIQQRARVNDWWGARYACEVALVARSRSLTAFISSGSFIAIFLGSRAEETCLLVHYL